MKTVATILIAPFTTIGAVILLIFIGQLIGDLLLSVF